MRDVGEQGEGKIATTGVATEEDVGWWDLQVVQDVVEERGGLLQLSG
jgi:hypothetical protein